MDKIQHTHSKAHVRKQLARSLLAQPLIQSHTNSPQLRQLPNHHSNLGLELKRSAEASGRCRVNRSSWPHVGRSGVSWEQPGTHRMWWSVCFWFIHGKTQRAGCSCSRREQNHVTARTAWVNTLWRCVRLSACVGKKWLVDWSRGIAHTCTSTRTSGMSAVPLKLHTCRKQITALPKKNLKNVASPCFWEITYVHF